MICVCHQFSIKLLNLHDGGNLHLLQEVNIFRPDQGHAIADCLQPPKMGGELIVATCNQHYFRVNMHEEYNAKPIGQQTTASRQTGGCIYLSGLQEESGRIVCSRPDSILFQTEGTRVTKSSQFKSKKIGALTFGSLFSPSTECVLSVTESHVVLINLRQTKVLSYESVSNSRQFYYDH